jgi:hypothetical protein
MKKKNEFATVVSSNDKNWSTQGKSSHWDLRRQKFPDPDISHATDGECSAGLHEYNTCVCVCEVRDDNTTMSSYHG